MKLAEILFLPILGAAFAALPLSASETVLNFEPASTEIHWTLDALLHTVHGTFKLKSGTVSFDPATGKASGRLVVSAPSGESGSESRDARMHKSILESAKFPDIVFTPKQVEGKVPAQGKAIIQVHGTFNLHGADHEMVLPVEVNAAPDQITADTRFSVPYIQWGLKNPSTLVLRVGDRVDIDIHAIGRTAPSGSK